MAEKQYMKSKSTLGFAKFYFCKFQKKNTLLITLLLAFYKDKYTKEKKMIILQ